MKFRNKHFELPFDVSTYFTGRDDINRELRKNCLPSKDPLAGSPQKRFVLYGLGGSGKTQMALKFASDHRERYDHEIFAPMVVCAMTSLIHVKILGSFLHRCQQC